MRRHVDQARAAGLQLCDVGAGQRLVARERDPFRRALAQPRIQRGDAVAAQLQQLEAADIHLVLVTAGFEDMEWWAVNGAGKFRRLP